MVIIHPFDYDGFDESQKFAKKALDLRKEIIK